MRRLDTTLALTDRVVLRPWELTMSSAMVRAVRDNADHIRQWLNWPHPDYGMVDAKEFIRRQLERSAADDGVSVGIWDGEILLGAVTMNHVDVDNRSTHLGYWLSKEAQGQGIMTKACQAVVDTLLVDRGYHRVVLAVQPENVKSRAVAEHVGFVPEGILRHVLRHGDRYIDWVIYAMLEPDWIRHQA